VAGVGSVPPGRGAHPPPIWQFKKSNFERSTPTGSTFMDSGYMMMMMVVEQQGWWDGGGGRTRPF